MSKTHIELNGLGRVGPGLAKDFSETGFKVIARS